MYESSEQRSPNVKTVPNSVYCANKVPHTSRQGDRSPKQGYHLVQTHVQTTANSVYCPNKVPHMFKQFATCMNRPIFWTNKVPTRPDRVKRMNRQNNVLHTSKQCETCTSRPKTVPHTPKQSQTVYSSKFPERLNNRVKHV